MNADGIRDFAGFGGEKTKKVKSFYSDSKNRKMTCIIFAAML